MGVFVKINQVVDEATDSSNTNDDKLSFLTNKFKKILKKHGNYNGKKFGHKYHKENIVCYECIKPRNYNSKCLNLERKKRRKRGGKKKKKLKKKTSFMSTWKDLDSSIKILNDLLVS